MELKEFRQYTQQEQKQLLIHWFHYYGKLICTLDEFKKFTAMIDEDSNQVMMMAVIGFMNGLTSQPILEAMRAGKLEELKSALPVFEEQNEKFKKAYLDEEKLLLGQMVATYNKPEPSIPMKPEDIANQIANVISKNKDR